jgi:hypothetical protein
MAGGGGSQTQTTEPPKYVRPYLEDAARASQDLYNRGPAQYYPGQTVVPHSQQTQDALSMTEQRARAGSPLVGNAQGYANNVLQGNFLNSNPYLDATFNRAADAVQNRVQSSFAGSGRNIEAGRGLAAQEMNDLASQIYGGNYQAERQRMQELVPQAGYLSGLDYADAERLAQVGQQHEDLSGRYMEDASSRWDFAQNAPGVNLDQYIARLNNQPGGSTTSPIYRNRAAGILGGAMAGQQIGSGFGYGGWGAGIGGLLGGLL